MARVLLQVAAVAAVGVLSACGSTGGGSGNAPVSRGPTTIVKGSSPVQLYNHIARQVRACWLNPADPVLTKHVFRAEAPAGGSPGGRAAKIEIHEQTKDLKRGLKAFSIDFQPRRDGTQIVARNLRLPYALGQKMMSDVGFWAQGGANCDGPVEAPSGGVARGSVSGPRVTQ